MDHLAASINGLRLGDPIIHGLARRIQIQELVALNGRIPISFDEKNGLPIGTRHRCLLVGECDTIVHAFAPLRFHFWSKIPTQDRDVLIELLKDNFILDTTMPSIKKFLNNCMMKRYREFKYAMSSHFLKFHTTEEARGNPFGNISPGNWSSLCDLFSAENIKNRCDPSRAFKASRVWLRRTHINQAIQNVPRVGDNASFRQNAIKIIGTCSNH
ncbi:hypothetical protein MKW94_007105 [Papaver nudicaule]|uniref:Uncharacterized protein n=1 Tax=Papaver nudicaule TaxID=74823 RepID=A0AA41S5P4_PAPNU|nr:hypothetical protein [Papaver nudicaule]